MGRKGGKGRRSRLVRRLVSGGERRGDETGQGAPIWGRGGCGEKRAVSERPSGRPPRAVGARGTQALPFFRTRGSPRDERGIRRPCRAQRCPHGCEICEGNRSDRHSTRRGATKGGWRAGEGRRRLAPRERGESHFLGPRGTTQRDTQRHPCDMLTYLAQTAPRRSSSKSSDRSESSVPTYQALTLQACPLRSRHGIWSRENQERPPHPRRRPAGRRCGKAPSEMPQSRAWGQRGQAMVRLRTRDS